MTTEEKINVDLETAAPETDERMITLVSAEGEKQPVPIRVAEMSERVKTMIDRKNSAMIHLKYHSKYI